MAIKLIAIKPTKREVYDDEYYATVRKVGRKDFPVTELEKRIRTNPEGVTPEQLDELSIGSLLRLLDKRPKLITILAPYVIKIHPTAVAYLLVDHPKMVIHLEDYLTNMYENTSWFGDFLHGYEGVADGKDALHVCLGYVGSEYFKTAYYRQFPDEFEKLSDEEKQEIEALINTEGCRAKDKEVLAYWNDNICVEPLPSIEFALRCDIDDHI